MVWGVGHSFRNFLPGVFFAILLGGSVIGGGGEPDLSFTDLQLPVYAPGVARPIARVSVARSRQAHLRKGFLRIGLFPIRVLEGVSILLDSPEHSRLVSDTLHRRLADRKRMRGLEVHGLHLNLGTNESRVRLVAGKAVHRRQSLWHLSQGFIEIRGRKNHFESATLQFGPDSPLLQLPNGRRLPLYPSSDSLPPTPDL